MPTVFIPITVPDDDNRDLSEVCRLALLEGAVGEVTVGDPRPAPWKAPTIQVGNGAVSALLRTVVLDALGSRGLDESEQDEILAVFFDDNYTQQTAEYLTREVAWNVKKLADAYQDATQRLWELGDLPAADSGSDQRRRQLFDASCKLEGFIDATLAQFYASGRRAKQKAEG